jgi:hypothetical protein
MKKILGLSLLMISVTFLHAEALKQAEVTRIINDVRVVNNGQVRPAVLDETVGGATAVQTGVKSRAELLFGDKTLARLGANTQFTFEQGTRNMNLAEGVMLLQVPKNAGGAKITTAAVTAAITGTTIFIEAGKKALGEKLSNAPVKVIVLEGTLRLMVNNRPGESTLINAGNMILMPQNARTIPQPVPVNLERIFKSSGLIQGMGNKKSDEANNQGGGGEGVTGGGQKDNFNKQQVLPSISEQNHLIATGQLAPTPLFVNGPVVSVGSPDSTQPFNSLQPPPLPPPDARGQKIQFLAPINQGNLVVDNLTTINLDPTIVKGGVVYPGGLWRNQGSLPVYLFGNPTYTAVSGDSLIDNTSGGNASQVDDASYAVFKFNGNVSVTAQPIVNVTAPAKGFGLLAVGSGNSVTVNAGNWNLANYSVAFATEGGPININNTTFSGTGDLSVYARGATGTFSFNSNSVFSSSGQFSTASGNNTVISGAINGASSADIESYQSIAINNNISVNNYGDGDSGHMEIKSYATSSNGITVSNSSQLKALAAVTADNSAIRLLTRGSDIAVSGPIDAGHSSSQNTQVILDTLGVSGGSPTSGSINASGTITGDTIAMRAGSSITIASSTTLNAPNILKLYGATISLGSGVTINSPNIVMYASSSLSATGSVNTGSTQVQLYGNSSLNSGPSGGSFTGGYHYNGVGVAPPSF